jgi:hypothetical protein
LADGRDRPGPFAIFRDSAALCRRRMWSLLSSTLVARLIEPAAQHYQRFIDSSDDAQHFRDLDRLREFAQGLPEAAECRFGQASPRKPRMIDFNTR